MLQRILTTTAILTGLGAMAAHAQSACETYTIQRGDSLAVIAKAAYGDTDQYRLIYDANRATIGANPDIISVGMVLQLPCSDGSAPAATAAAASTAESGGADTGVFAAYVDSGILTAGQAPANSPATPPSGDFSPFIETITFVTGGNYSPFTGPELLEGGMYTDLVRTALLRADANRPMNVEFVDDWSVHLTQLLPAGSFDMGFPWYLPDCTNLEPLNDADRSRCTEFDHSDAFYEIEIGMYVRADSAYLSATTPEDLYGATLCRPAGYFQFDIAQMGLMANANFVTPATPDECLQMMMTGEVDAFTINLLTGEDEIQAAGLVGQVVELEALSSVQTLHVLTPKSNPRGQAQLALLNQGLRNMVESGEWFLIVSRHLSMTQ